jgi:hypothetical protein
MQMDTGNTACGPPLGVSLQALTLAALVGLVRVDWGKVIRWLEDHGRAGLDLGEAEPVKARRLKVRVAQPIRRNHERTRDRESQLNGSRPFEHGHGPGAVVF